MEALLSALVPDRRLLILEALLGAQHGDASALSQAELRLRLNIPDSQRGTLSKDIDALVHAGLLAATDRRYQLVHAKQTRTLLTSAARLVALIDARAAEQAAAKAKHSADLVRRWRSVAGGR